MAEPPEYDMMVKLLVTGDSQSGKTAFVQRYACGDFDEKYVSTIGIDFKVKTLEIDDKKVKAQIWDTAGQERFRTITSAYYRGANGIFILYDVTDQETFDAVSRWHMEAESYASEGTPVALVGTKCDLDGLRIIEFATAKEFADDNKLPVYDVSSKTGEGVQEAFEDFIRITCEKMEAANKHRRAAAAPPPEKKKTSVCTIL